MKDISMLSVVLLVWFSAAVSVCAANEVLSEAALENAAPPTPLTAPEEEIVVLCCGFDVSPTHEWTVSIAGQTIGLLGWGDATELVFGDHRAWIPWRAPIVAGALGTSIFLLFVGAAVTLRPQGVDGAEAS